MIQLGVVGDHALNLVLYVGAEEATEVSRPRLRDQYFAVKLND